ncbi:hypothetical protein STSP2_03557 [Anaerohalosphaera lusitana]|uniref:Uncharacterized protein n=1 Tax=Anaerohalosphaera lusitana TaxID=1936003 RepID=A0A1U9NR02_9BACT|nr:hypothetical protein [Anaerohalosphaera lusitana]AQT70351.1 hypothetical protein STSP2_03557 [Anaerohalosphaera lusitana]
MDKNDLYAHTQLGKTFRKYKLISIFVFIGACLLNPVIDELAFFIAGAAVVMHGALYHIDKKVRQQMVLAKDARLEKDKLEIYLEEQKCNVVADLEGDCVQKADIQGVEYVSINVPMIICEVDGCIQPANSVKEND